MRYGYKTMTPEDYLYNQRDAKLARSAHRTVLKPLENANQGDIMVSGLNPTHRGPQGRDQSQVLNGRIQENVAGRIKRFAVPAD